ncbi:MAG: porin [Flavobacteriales bacterium]|nr:porin [Flavobacteriales bacterium]
MKKGIILLISIFTLNTISAQTVVDSKFGNGLFNVIAADSSWSMKFGARFQTLFIGGFDNNEKDGIKNANSNFLIRRSRLKFGGFIYTPKLKYKLEFGLSNKDISGISAETKSTPRIILDAVLKWNFYKNFTIWAGQTKLPGNRERVISSGNLQFVDRSLVNSRYNIDRDIGVQLRHHLKVGNKFVIREAIAFSQGEGRNITVGNLGGYDWTARVEFLPFGKFAKKGDYVGSDRNREKSPKLAIGVTYDMHDRAVRENGNTKTFMTNDIGYFQTDINTLFADLMFKYKGFSVMAEYADKTADDIFAKNSDSTLTGDNVTVGTGFNFQAGYLFKNNVELAGRYTAIDPAKELKKEVINQYTLGVSKYLVGHKLKVQGDLSYTTEDGQDDNIMYRLQFDLHF